MKVETELAFRIMTDPSGKVTSHSLQKKFSKLLQFHTGNLQHTQWRMNKTRLSAVKFIRKSWSKSINKGIVYNWIGLKCICATRSKQNTELFYKLFTRGTESGKSKGGCNFGNFLPIKVPKCYREKIHVFDKKLSKSSDFYYLEPGVYPSITALRILLKPWKPSFEKDTITARIVSQLEFLEERKKLRYTLQMEDLVLHSLVRIWDTFSEVKLVMNLEYWWEEKDLKNQNLLTTLSAYTLSGHTRSWLSTKLLATPKLHCCVAFLSFRSSRLETL